MRTVNKSHKRIVTCKKRKDRISERVKSKVKEFYLSAGISKENPNKKTALQIKKKKTVTIIPHHNMLMSLEDAYNVFLKTYPNMKIGFTMFRKLHPVQVSRASETNRCSCLCEKCSNVALKVEALKRFKSTHDDLKGVEIVSSKRQIVSNTLCKSEKPYADMKCINRQCSKCGTQKIQDKYRAFSQFNEETIKWHKWERVNIESRKRRKM